MANPAVPTCCTASSLRRLEGFVNVVSFFESDDLFYRCGGARPWRGKATVYIYRPGKFFGKALEPSVFLDEQKVFDMDNARYLVLRLAPGRHILRSNEKNSELDQVWEGGQSYDIKITIAAGMMKGHGQMGMVTEKLALKEMQGLRPLDKDNVEPGYLNVVDLTPLK
jgi:hypothetical protein